MVIWRAQQALCQPEYWINEPILPFFHSLDNSNIDRVGQSNDRIGQHLLNISDYYAYWVLPR